MTRLTEGQLKTIRDRKIGPDEQAALCQGDVSALFGHIEAQEAEIQQLKSAIRTFMPTTDADVAMRCKILGLADCWDYGDGCRLGGYCYPLEVSNE